MRNDPTLQNVTELRRAWGNGDEAGLAQVTPVVCEELHRSISNVHPSYREIAIGRDRIVLSCR